MFGSKGTGREHGVAWIETIFMRRDMMIDQSWAVCIFWDDTTALDRSITLVRRHTGGKREQPAIDYKPGAEVIRLQPNSIIEARFSY